jgi:hypothetical protein
MIEWEHSRIFCLPLLLLLLRPQNTKRELKDAEKQDRGGDRPPLVRKKGLRGRGIAPRSM